MTNFISPCHPRTRASRATATAVTARFNVRLVTDGFTGKYKFNIKQILYYSSFEICLR